MRVRTNGGTTAVAAVSVAMFATLIAACGGGDSGGDKAGGKAPPRTLTLGTVEDQHAPYADEVEHFATTVESMSNGSIDVDIKWAVTGEFSPTTEQQVAELVRDGKLDMALVPTRVWDTFDVTSMQALQTPFLVDSLGLADSIATSQMADEMMAGLDTIGLHGLALWPESLRHPIGMDRPLLTVDDFAGARLRVPASDLSQQLAVALGVEPVDPPDWDVALANGELDGFESAFQWAGDLPGPGTFTGNITFYPKVNTVVANADVFGTLDGDQQDQLRAAAIESIGYLAGTGQTERDLAAAYCATGGSVAIATVADVGALVAKAAPVVAQLERDTTTKQLIAQIRTLKGDYADGTAAAPEACGSAAEDAPAAQVSAVSTTDFPEGVYRTDSPLDGIVTFSFIDGVWDRYAQPNGPVDCEAAYEVKDGRIFLTTSSDPALDCDNPHGKVFLDAAWTLVGDELHFVDINSGPAAVWEFGLPWTRVVDDDSGSAAEPTTEVAFPNGVYRAEGVDGGVVTMNFTDGVWQGFTANGQLDCDGTYTVDSGRIWMSNSTDPALACGNPPGLQFLNADWTLDGDQLRFTDIESDPNAVRDFGLDWTKIE